MSQRKWFMSYMFSSKAGGFGFGSCVQKRDEHPIAVVNRWNKEYPERITVLLSFLEMPDDAPETDAEAWT